MLDDLEDVPSMGPDLLNRTYYPKGAHADNSKKPWYIIDAEGQTLGRLAVLAAQQIRCLSAKFVHIYLRIQDRIRVPCTSSVTPPGRRH